VLFLDASEEDQLTFVFSCMLSAYLTGFSMMLVAVLQICSPFDRASVGEVLRW
jgi:hypothetical protein